MIRVADPLSTAARQLMAEGDVEYAPLYPPELNFTLSPEQLAAENALFVLLEEAGHAIGCGAYSRKSGYAELKRIFVTADHRGQGHARRILADLEARATAEGIPCLRLESGEESPEALILYERAGYHRRAPFGDYTENGSSVFMEKPLG